MKSRRNWIFITFTWLLATGLVWAYGVFRAHFAASPGHLYRVEKLEKELAQAKEEKAKLAYQFEDFRQNAALHWPEARKKDYRWPASITVDLSSALYEKGRGLFRDKKWDLALDVFTDLIKSYPQSRWIAEAYYYECETLFQVRDFKSSATCVSEMIELFPENPLSGIQLMRLGQVHEIHGQLAEALEIYRLVNEQFKEPELQRQSRDSISRLE